MFWLAAIVIVIVIVLGAIFIRFPAQTLGVIASLIGLWYVLYLNQEKETRRREERDNNVVVRIGYNASVCARETPLAVTIMNTNVNSTVSRVSWRISAYRPGYSSDVVAYDYNHTSFSSDKILAPKESVGWCYAIPKLTTTDDPSALLYQVHSKSVSFYAQ
jgi:hypothetical protein